MEKPPVKIEKNIWISLLIYFGILTTIGTVLGIGFVYLLKSQKPVIIIDHIENSTDRYLNPIDIDPLHHRFVYKVPEPDEAVKVFTGYEEDSPISFSRKRGRGISLLNKCICGNYHDHEDCTGTNCVEGCGCGDSLNRTNTIYGR